MRRPICVAAALVLLLAPLTTINAATGQNLAVPYRSQLDGNPYEESDCGPAAMAMVLGAYGRWVPTSELRGAVNDLQDTWGDVEAGTTIENIGVVVSIYGLRPRGLFEADGKTLRRWSLDELRQQLDAGHPVIPQVWYRALPGRMRRPYEGDHYVVITGYVGDDFIYNDPIDADGVGDERRISAWRLDLAWRNSDFPYAAVAVAGPADRPGAPALPLDRPAPLRTERVVPRATGAI